MRHFSLIFFLACGISTAADGSSSSESEPEEGSKLLDVFRRVAPAGSKGDQALSHMSAHLKSSFLALPKNSRGRLPPRGVRHLLRNHFAKRHGWLLRGLEHHGNSRSSGKGLHEVSIIQHKSHAIKKALLEARVPERGLSLKEVGALSVALETLVQGETIAVLDYAYKVRNESEAASLSLMRVRKLLHYYITILTDGFKDYVDAYAFDEKEKEFVEDALQTVIQRDRLHLNRFNENPFEYRHVWRMVELVNRRYAQHQNKDCIDMKRALAEIDPMGQGRVPVKAFYRKGKTSTYGFKESLDYLRKSGSLDESEKDDPRVLIANYVEGPGNCISNFQHFSVCCLPESVDVMQKLEHEVGASSATPEQLLGIVQSISTSSVKAPRELNRQLVEKLEYVASVHGGQVPLHGRLFSQWLHFAFPYDYPYPNIVTSMSGLSSINRYDTSHWVSKAQLAKVEKLPDKTQTFMGAWTDSEFLPLIDTVGSLDTSATEENAESPRWNSITDALTFIIFFSCSIRLAQVVQKKFWSEKNHAKAQKDMFQEPGKLHHKTQKQKDSATDALKEKPVRTGKAKSAKLREEKDLSCRKPKAHPKVVASKELSSASRSSHSAKKANEDNISPKIAKMSNEADDRPGNDDIQVDTLTESCLANSTTNEVIDDDINPSREVSEPLEEEEEDDEEESCENLAISEKLMSSTITQSTQASTQASRSDATEESPVYPDSEMQETCSEDADTSNEAQIVDSIHLTPMQEPEESVHIGSQLAPRQVAEDLACDSSEESPTLLASEDTDNYQSLACQKLVERILPKLRTFAPPPGLEMFGPSEFDAPPGLGF